MMFEEHENNQIFIVVFFIRLLLDLRQKNNEFS